MKTIKNRSRRKKTTAVISAVLTVALLITGTLAWVTTSSALNEISQPGESDEPGGILHDDFDGENDPGTGDYNKDVYVENTGNTDIYVRVKLEEIMDIGSDQRPDTPWVLHTPSTDSEGNLCHEDCENVNQQSKYFHDYFTMDWGYDRVNDTYSSKWYLPSSAASGENFKDDGNGTYIQDNTNYADMSQSDKEELGLKETPAGKIISMDAYLALSASDRTDYVGWIYDSDGWAYWSQPLASGTATSLLLDQVLINADKLEELNKSGFYYAINVIMECVDKADLEAGWLGGTYGDGTAVSDVTDEAKEFLEGITGGGTTPTVDKSGLEKAIKDADALDTTGVIQKLIDDLDAAVAAGKVVLADDAATQEAVDAATKAIQDAIDAIKVSERVDKSDLEQAIEDAGEVDTSRAPDSLIDALDEAVAAGEAVLEDKNATQDMVDAATEAIKDAIDAINDWVDKTGLEQAIKDAGEVDTTGVLQNLIDALDAAVAAGEAVLADADATQAEVDAAAQAIDDAIAAISGSEKVDKSDLEQAIEDAGEVDTSRAPDSLIDALDEAVAAGEAVLEDKNATQDMVDAATEAIKDAIDAINDWVDKTGLEQAIKDAGEVDTTGVVQNLIDALDAAVAAGEAVLADADATQAEVDDATQAIYDAIAAISGSERVDKSDLEQAIEDAGKVDTDRAPDSLIDALDEAVAAGEAVLEDKNATQDMVDAATDAIQDAIDAINSWVDKTELVQAIRDAGEVDTTGVLQDLIDALDDAVAAGKAVLVDLDATQEEVDAATQAIRDAIDAINGSDKVDKSALEQAITDAGELDTDDIPSAFSTLLDDLDAAVAAGEDVLADGNATQDEVDAATDAINDAIDAINKVLVLKSNTLDTDWSTNDNFYCSFIWIDGEEPVDQLNYDLYSNGIPTKEYAYGYIPLGDFLYNTDFENHPVTVNVITEGIPQDSIYVGWGIDASLKNSYWCRDLTGVPCIVLTYLPTKTELLASDYDSWFNRYIMVTFTLTQDGKTSEEITIRSTYSGAF